MTIVLIGILLIPISEIFNPSIIQSNFSKYKFNQSIIFWISFIILLGYSAIFAPPFIKIAGYQYDIYKSEQLARKEREQIVEHNLILNKLRSDSVVPLGVKGIELDRPFNPDLIKKILKKNNTHNINENEDSVISNFLIDSTYIKEIWETIDKIELKNTETNPLFISGKCYVQDIIIDSFPISLYIYEINGKNGLLKLCKNSSIKLSYLLPLY